MDPQVEQPSTPRGNFFTTVTPFSKAVALALFILLPLATLLLGMRIESQMHPIPATPQPIDQIVASKNQVNESSPSAQIAGWKTYTTDGFSFKYPADKFTVEERVRSFLALKPISSISGFAGISIDARTQAKPYTEAIEELKSELVNPKVETISNGVKISGIYGPSKSEGVSAEGTETTVAFLNYKGGYIRVESTDKESFPYFDQILSTFTFTK